MQRRALTATLTLLFCVCAGGCDERSLRQFGDFAAAGTAYVTAAHTFFQDAGVAFIAAGSASLVSARANAEGTQGQDAEYRARLISEDRQAQIYLQNLRTIDLHAALLGKYFAAITDITSGKASQGAAEHVSGLADAIASLNPKIGSIKIGSSDLKSGLAPVTTLAMARFELKALNDEMAKHGKNIDEALALQESAVKAIAQQMQANTDAASFQEEQTRVVAPYIAAGPLPRRWSDDRAAFLQRTAVIDSAEAAEKAIKELHEAYRTLLSSKDTKLDLKALFEAIGQMAGYASAAQSTN